MDTLLIDDDAIGVFLTERLLKREGFSTDIASFSSAEEALAFLQQASESTFPHVIFLDVNMPVMDGWEFLDAFRTLPLEQPVCVFILTSSINPEDIDKATHYQEVRGYFSKPLDKPNVQRMQSLLHEVGDYQY